MYQRKLRATGLVLLPIVLSGLACLWLVNSYMRAELDRQADHFGSAIAQQLSLSVTDYLVNEDILSLNVVLNDLVERGNFAFASVYSVDHRLLAQAGRRPTGTSAYQYAQDITWQNASMGSLEIGLDQQSISTPITATITMILLIHLLIALVAGTVIWRFADLVYLWVALPRPQPQDPLPTTPAPTAEMPASEPQAGTVVLVIKLQPARLLADYLPRIEAAIALYGGELTPQEGDALIAQFSQQDPVYRAICGGLLILTLFKPLDSITLKLGMHTTEGFTADTAGNSPGPDTEPALANARKHASYLATLAEQRLLTSEQVVKQLTASARIVFSPYHNSLAPAGQVFQIDSLEPAQQALLQSQASQLNLG